MLRAGGPGRVLEPIVKLLLDLIGHEHGELILTSTNPPLDLRLHIGHLLSKAYGLLLALRGGRYQIICDGTNDPLLNR